MRARQHVNLYVHMYLLPQQELDQSIFADAAPGPFIAPAHMPSDIMNDVIS